MAWSLLREVLGGEFPETLEPTALVGGKGLQTRWTIHGKLTAEGNGFPGASLASASWPTLGLATVGIVGIPL